MDLDHRMALGMSTDRSSQVLANGKIDSTALDVWSKMSEAKFLTVCRVELLFRLTSRGK
jgi:hypothetical protein